MAQFFNITQTISLEQEANSWMSDDRNYLHLTNLSELWVETITFYG